LSPLAGIAVIRRFGNSTNANSLCIFLLGSKDAAETYAMPANNFFENDGGNVPNEMLFFVKLLFVKVDEYRAPVKSYENVQLISKTLQTYRFFTP
jgi:hypothetical protein